MATVADALSAIRTRAIAAGHNPTDTQVLATYNRDVARGNTLATIIAGSGGRSTTNTPAQTMVPSSAGPVGSTAAGASPTGSALSAGLGDISPNVLLLGGAALLVLILLRKK